MLFLFPYKSVSVNDGSFGSNHQLKFKTMPKFRKLLQENLQWVSDKLKQDENYFTELAKDQKPDFLWIGCSDSRIRVNHLAGAHAGEIFVHRNIANQVLHTDFNLLSVVQYATEVLEVDHIIICGHYNCGGIKAALSNEATGYISNWIEGIKTLYRKNKQFLDAVPDFQQRADKLAEMNVLMQTENLVNTDIIQKAWEKRNFKVHSVIYNMYNGKLLELQQKNQSETIKLTEFELPTV